jgi:short subunit dehydrogenase-like uncharacterized protein
MSTQPHDLIVFGATSFVGQILTRYLAEQFGAHGSLKWAIAGRSESKLAGLRNSLGLAAGKVPLLVADAADEAALRRLCKDTRVVISTVGPYALYGEPLVKVCAETGTDYCDLTGEVQWIRRMVRKYDKAAAPAARASCTVVASIRYRRTSACISCSSRHTSVSANRAPA